MLNKEITPVVIVAVAIGIVAAGVMAYFLLGAGGEAAVPATFPSAVGQSMTYTFYVDNQTYTRTYAVAQKTIFKGYSMYEVQYSSGENLMYGLIDDNGKCWYQRLTLGTLTQETTYDYDAGEIIMHDWETDAENTIDMPTDFFSRYELHFFSGTWWKNQNLSVGDTLALTSVWWVPGYGDLIVISAPVELSILGEETIAVQAGNFDTYAAEFKNKETGETIYALWIEKEHELTIRLEQYSGTTTIVAELENYGGL